MSSPGPNPSRQDAPHPHEALMDPTNSYIVVPDLGADLVRVFSINSTTSMIIPTTSFSAPPGSGPRHGAFTTHGSDTYFFLVSELANTVASYKVTYCNDGLTFAEVFESGFYGNMTTPEGAAAAEAILSPDQLFLLTSSRNATLFDIQNFDPHNSTRIPSDTLQSWAVDSNSGALSFNQLAPAGGSFTRKFSLNRNGTLVAVGLQDDSRVVIIEWNIENGRFGNFVAEVDIPGQITSVIWDE